MLSFKLNTDARRLSSLAPVCSSLRTLCRFSPQMTASERSRLRKSTGETRLQLMRKTPAPLHNVSCPQRTSILERPAQIAWSCSLRHCHCSTLRYLPLLLWSPRSYMFWMAKVPDNNSEVYDVGDRRLTYHFGHLKWHR